MGCLLDVGFSNAMGIGSVAGPVFTLAQVDGFKATIVSCIRFDESDSAACHLQNLYHNTNMNSLSIFYDQLVGSRRTFVPPVVPVSWKYLLHLSANRKVLILTLSQDPTLEIYVMSS